MLIINQLNYSCFWISVFNKMKTMKGNSLNIALKVLKYVLCTLL